MTGDLIARASNDLAREGKLKKIYTGSDTIDFEMSNLPEDLVDRVHRLFADPLAACIDKKPVPGAYCFLRFLELIGHKVGIVTARPIHLKEPTNYILYRDFPKIRFDLGVHFINKRSHCRNEVSKKEILRSIRPNFYFDDNYNHCKDAVNVNVENVYLVQNKHTGWNKTITSTKEIQTIRNIAFLNERLIWDIRQDQTMRHLIH